MKILKKIFKWTTSGVGFTVLSKLIEVIFTNGNTILEMPLKIIFSGIFGFWAVKVLIILAGIFAFYISIKAICRWHQKTIDESIQKAFKKNKHK